MRMFSLLSLLSLEHAIYWTGQIGYLPDVRYPRLDQKITGKLLPRTSRGGLSQLGLGLSFSLICNLGGTGMLWTLLALALGPVVVNILG